MIVSLTAGKIAMSALVILIIVMCIDEANGTGPVYVRSPLWIALPGALAALTFLGASLVALIAMIWGL